MEAEIDAGHFFNSHLSLCLLVCPHFTTLGLFSILRYLGPYTSIPKEPKVFNLRLNVMVNSEV